MKKIVSAIACALALGMGGGAHAGLVTFDPPSLIDINPVTFGATYTEAGFVLSGDAASFLPLDGIGRAGSEGLFVLGGATLTLAPVNGGLFDLLSIDYGLFDPSTAGSASELMIHGLFADSSQRDLTLGLGSLSNVAFQNWKALRQVSFLANTEFVLDNLNVVPEPGSMALVGTSLALLLLARRGSGGTGAGYRAATAQR